MQYRILPLDEWKRLGQVMDPKYIPHPNSAYCAVAEDDSGEITGALFMQVAMHTEPLILTTPKASFKRLLDTLLDQVKEHKGMHYYVFTDKEVVKKMAAHVGMKETGFHVFEGEVV